MDDSEQRGQFDGWIDGVAAGQIFGWCLKIGSRDPVSLEFLADGATRSLLTTGQPRPGISHGRCGFSIPVGDPDLLDSTKIAVRVEGTEYRLKCKVLTLGDLRALRAGQPNPDPRPVEDHANLRPILRKFESLGYNCEFGLVQRHFGVEGIGLLRWGAFWDGFPGLLKALSARFAGVGDAVSVYVQGREYISLDETYRLVFHTNQQEGSIEPALLIKNERIRMSYLAKKLLEDIESEAKIFVYKSNEDLSIEEVEQLLTTLAAIGRPWLFWVTRASDPERVGVVEVLGPRLLRGHIDRFSPQSNVHLHCSYDLWARLCTKASELVS